MGGTVTWGTYEPSLSADGELLDELWGNVHVHAATGCWEYLGGRMANEYPYINWKGKRYSGHRLSLELGLGRPLAPDMVAAHYVCDFRPCVCPQHLSEWTQAQNIEDRDAKGRHAKHKGEDASGSVLNDDKVRSILRHLAEGLLLQREIGDLYGVNRVTISDIHTGKSWKHIPRPFRRRGL